MTTTPELDELVGVAGLSPDEQPEKFTLLETWREVLSNIEAARAEHLSPQEVSRVLKSWPNLKVQEMVKYHTKFYDFLTDMRKILTLEIESDPECLKNIDDDAVDNRTHYLNLLMLWQVQIQQWSKEWNCTAKDAHLDMAALAETQNFFFGENGLLQHLDSIQFEMTDADNEVIAEAILEVKGA